MKLRRWQFLLISMLIILIILALGTDRYFALVRQAQEQIRLQRTEQIVSGTLPSRGGHQCTATTMPVTTPSGFSAARFERAFAGTPLAGIGEALVQAEAETGVNALILAGICAHESGWGQSRLAREKNNLAGLGAYDDAPGRAMRFESRAECVMFLARLLRERPGSLEEIGTWYASDSRWAVKVAGCMRIIAEAER